jgi:hypothetical protein
MKLNLTILLILPFIHSLAQENVIKEIQHCLIYDNVFDGLNVENENSCIIMDSEINGIEFQKIIKFDSLGRIIEIEDKYYISEYNYTENSIIKTVSSSYPPQLRINCSYYKTQYNLDSLGNIKSCSIECMPNSSLGEEKYLPGKREHYYVYDTVSNNMIVINIINQDTIWKQEIFFLNNCLFRWETYIVEMEFVYFRYFRRLPKYSDIYNIISSLAYSMYSDYGEYEKNEIPLNDTILAKYSILDSSNNHIGNMEIKKCE